MRIVYAGLLFTGLFLIGASIYESGTTTTDQTTETGTVSAMEDGTPMPSPNGPKPSK